MVVWGTSRSASRAACGPLLVFTPEGLQLLAGGRHEVAHPRSADPPNCLSTLKGLKHLPGARRYNSFGVEWLNAFFSRVADRGAPLRGDPRLRAATPRGKRRARPPSPPPGQDRAGQEDPQGEQGGDREAHARPIPAGPRPDKRKEKPAPREQGRVG